MNRYIYDLIKLKITKGFKVFKKENIYYWVNAFFLLKYLIHLISNVLSIV